MGMVQQAVLDFDEEIQAPWRPRLVAVVDGGASAAEPWAAPAPLRPQFLPRRHLPPGRGRCRAACAGPARASAPSGSSPSGVRGACRAVRVVGVRRAAVGFRLTRRARRLAAVLTLAVGVAIGSWLGPLMRAVTETSGWPVCRAWSCSPVTRCGRSRRTPPAPMTSARSSTASRAQRPPRHGPDPRPGPRAPVTTSGNVVGPTGRRARYAWWRRTSRQETHNVAARLRQPSVRARSHSVVAPALTVVACQAPWRTEQRCSRVSPRLSRSIRPEPGGRANCSAGGTMPTGPARCGSASSSAVSRNGLDRPRHPAPAGASPLGGAVRGGRPRAATQEMSVARHPSGRRRAADADAQPTAGLAAGPVRRARPARDRRAPHRGRDGPVRVRGPSSRARTRRDAGGRASPRPRDRRGAGCGPSSGTRGRHRRRAAGCGRDVTAPRATAAVTARRTPDWFRSSPRPRDRLGRRRPSRTAGRRRRVPRVIS